LVRKIKTCTRHGNASSWDEDDEDEPRSCLSFVVYEAGSANILKQTKRCLCFKKLLIGRVSECVIVIVLLYDKIWKDFHVTLLERECVWFYYNYMLG